VLVRDLRGRVQTNGIAGKLWIRGDQEQLGFALKALLRGLCRETGPETPIHVDAPSAAELCFRSARGASAQQKLHGLLDHATNGSGPPSLDFIMTNALMRRNGGSSHLDRDQQTLSVRLKFASAEPTTNE